MNEELATWTDGLGKQRKAPTLSGRLKFKIPLHRALRAFVFARDGFTCQACGARPATLPTDYDGRNAVSLDGPKNCLVMDHVTSRRNGGAHHPSNLQTMCEPCNAAKAGLVDAKASRSA